jgi:hypothetical protein
MRHNTHPPISLKLKGLLRGIWWPAWKRWSPILLRPEGLYGTRPAEGGNKAAKLKAIREALRKVKRVWLATDWIARVSSSVRKSSSITSTAARSCG